MGLTKALDNKLLFELEFELNGNTHHKVCYEKFITKNDDCYQKIIRYYKMQTGLSLPPSLKLNTPILLKIGTDNNIIFTLTLNNSLMIFVADTDLNSIFKEEIREHKLSSIFNK
jgi:hypothetical protein